jgi:hypothetical protein
VEPAVILKRLREQRQTWLDLGSGRSVCVQRPLEAEFGKLIAGIEPAHVVEHVVDWRGFTETTLFGASVGGDTAVPFDRELWSEYVRDRVDDLQQVAKAIADAVQAHLEQRGLIQGKLAPSST